VALPDWSPQRREVIYGEVSPNGPLLIILTLRADFYDRVMQYPDLYRLVDAHHCAVLPMEVSDLRQVIKGPADLPDVKLKFEDDLVSDLLFEVRGQVGALPLLQFTLDELFQQRDRHLLTRKAYEKMRGVKGALSQHAEKTYGSLPTEDHRKLARILFLRLIAPGITEQETTRRRARLSELEVDNPTQTYLLRETADSFIAARLLTAGEVAGAPTIEVSHEAVIRAWPRLVGWVHGAQEDLRLQHTLSSDVAAWVHQKSAEYLYRGAQLKEARAWARRNVPSANERAFLRASTRQRVQFIVSVIVIILMILSTGTLAGWLYFQRQPDPTHVTTLGNDGVGSLRWAMSTAPINSTITFDQDLEGKTLVLTNNLITAQKNLRIVGPGAGKLTVSNREHFIQVVSGTSLTLSGLTFAGSKSNSSPLLKNDGVLTLSNCIISGNTNSFKGATLADAFGGGGIYNDGILTLNTSSISGNSSSLGQGGGISNYVSGTVTLNNSTISGNTASVGGGGYNLGTFTLNKSTISGNTASSNGGGIGNGNKLILNNSRVTDNTATAGSGGGISSEGTVTLTSSTVSGNTIYYGVGGGIDNAGTLTLANSTVSDNTTHGGPHCGSCGSGAGISGYTGKLILINSTISDNTASQGSGGGIYVSSLVEVTISFCTFYNNTAQEGGGIAIIADTSITVGDPALSHRVFMLRNSLIAGNHALTSPDVMGTLTSDGYNLVQIVSGITFLDPNHEHHTDLSGAQFPELFIDSKLQENHGATLTHALLSGSPAINAIPLEACHINAIITDQRGMKRPGGKKTACDIGAYESQV